MGYDNSNNPTFVKVDNADLKKELKTDFDSLSTGINTDITQFKTQTTAQLADKAKKAEVILKSDGVGLDNAKPDLLAAIQNKDGVTTFNLLSEPRAGSVTKEKIDSNFYKELIADSIVGNTQYTYLNGEVDTAKEYLNAELIREKQFYREANYTREYEVDKILAFERVLEYFFEPNGDIKSVNTLSAVKKYSKFNYFLTVGMVRLFGTTMNQYSTDNITPTDVSSYSRVAFIIKNNHDKAIVATVYSSTDLTPQPFSSIPVSGTHEKLNLAPITIQPKSTFILDETVVGSINNDFKGILLRLERANVPTEGDIEVVFLAK